MRNAPWWVCSTFEVADDVTYAWSTMYDGIMTEHIKKLKAKIRTDSLPWVDSCIRKLMNNGINFSNSAMGLTKQLSHGKNIKK